MRTCYEIADIITSIVKYDNSKGPLPAVLVQVIPELNAHEARVRLIGMFNDAIEQVSLLFHLDQSAIDDMLSQLKSIQGDAFMALAQDTVAQFKGKIKYPTSVTTLRLVGNAVAALPARNGAPFVRDKLEDDISRWLREIELLEIPQIQKVVLTIKFKSLLRFLIECKGATTEEVLRRMKSLADDLSSELNLVSDTSRPVLEKIRDSLLLPVKHTAKAISLASDMLSVATVLGPAAIALLSVSDPVLSLPPPPSSDPTSSNYE